VDRFEFPHALFVPLMVSPSNHEDGRGAGGEVVTDTSPTTASFRRTPESISSPQARLVDRRKADPGFRRDDAECVAPGVPASMI